MDAIAGSVEVSVRVPQHKALRNPMQVGSDFGMLQAAGREVGVRPEGLNLFGANFQ